MSISEEMDWSRLNPSCGRTAITRARTHRVLTWLPLSQLCDVPRRDSKAWACGRGRSTSGRIRPRNSLFAADQRIPGTKPCPVRGPALRAATRQASVSTSDRVTDAVGLVVAASMNNFAMKMTETFDFTEGEAVEMWTTRRLPYIDRQTTGERAALERLRRALRLLPDDQSTILSARYTSSHDGSFDVENVLAYNVGMSAFRGAARRGMIFERVRATPPAAPSELLYDHHHAYELSRHPLARLTALR